MKDIDRSEITPEHLFLSRRKFMLGAAALAGAALLPGCGDRGGGSNTQTTVSPGPVGATTDELGQALTSFEAVTGYNNFYEFTVDKDSVADLARDFATRPWTVEVAGLVARPQVLPIDELLAEFPERERIYRMRCVEAWSMVIPWLGFPLRLLLDQVVPQPQARYVRFISIDAPDRLPGQRKYSFDWPYTEGLRLDEAMNDLTLIATGLYGKQLLPQNGAPLRLVVPWKYGFKSIKSIVRIELVQDRPATFWSSSAPHEYGFYANVNPEVDHPRWSQKSERRIGETGRRDTLPFNGYGEEVAGLYEGMDLRKDF